MKEAAANRRKRETIAESGRQSQEADANRRSGRQSRKRQPIAETEDDRATREEGASHLARCGKNAEAFLNMERRILWRVI